MRRRGESVFERPSTITSREPNLQTDRDFTVDSAEGTATMSMDYGPATVRDRTKEFAAAAERAAKSSGASSIGASSEGGLSSSGIDASPGASSGSTGATGEFARSSARIGRGIHATSQKLERLAQLAKRSGTFDDPSQDIAQLSAVIKQDITALNSALAELQTFATRTQETKQGRDHSVTVVDTLKSRLMGATRSFKEVLTTRQEVVKEQNERRARFVGTSSNANGPPSNAFRRADFGVGRSHFPRATHQTDGAAPGDGTDRTTAGRFQPRGGNAQGMLPTHSGRGGYATGGDQTQGQLLVAHGQDQYLGARSEALQNVERTITELGGIFQQLATMVAEQGELAVRIDENVNESVANVDNAQTQLLKYMNSISSNRWLIMKIFGVLISFLVFFVVFVA